ncbi:MAG TPA: cation:dicarboxylase symporter family transporter, partial [Acidobacteriaceae bacterium]|nr:cation:dicarboxylase symporter family transporter [Acidobacteriaceae bacterium]
LTSKGVAGIPRGAFVVLFATLPAFGLPAEGATMLLGVDVLMDMMRTSINVLGNCLATAIVARWEGASLQQPADQMALQVGEFL